MMIKFIFFFLTLIATYVTATLPIVKLSAEFNEHRKHTTFDIEIQKNITFIEKDQQQQEDYSYNAIKISLNTNSPYAFIVHNQRNNRETAPKAMLVTNNDSRP
eukprot:UN03495